jgi:hypothetical protein
MIFVKEEVTNELITTRRWSLMRCWENMFDGEIALAVLYQT